MAAAFKQDDVFVIVKAYASRGSLLSRAMLEELSNSRSVDEMAAKLKTSSYGDQVTTSAGGMSARKLESMLRSSLSVFNFELLKYYRKPGFLQGYFERNLSWNLKVAVKGKALGMTYEDLSDMIVLKAEELAGRRDLVVRILSATSLDQVVSLLGDSDVRPFMAQALATFRQTRDVSTFDLYIDRYTMGKLASAFARRKGLRRLYGKPNPVVKELVGGDVDSFDVLAVLRSKWLDLPTSKIEELLVTPAFFLDADTLDKMVSAPNVQAAAGVLSHSTYRKVVPMATTPEAIIGGMEDNFFRRTLKIARRTFSNQPMSEPVLLGALKAREVEVRNLSSIAFGVEVGLQPQEIIAKLIVA